jgi:diguanylate cyclase (GGDEF)-like protein
VGASTPIDASDGRVSRLTGELVDASLERSFRDDLATDSHQVWSWIAMIVGVVFVAFSAVDLGTLGAGPTWLALLVARALGGAVVVLAGIGLARDPTFPNVPAGRAALVAAQLLTGAIALVAAAVRPADALTSALSLTVFVIAATVVVPGRFRDQVAVGASVAGGLVLVSATRFDDPALPILPLVANLAGAVVLGGTIRMLMNRDQRRRWLAGLRLADQLAEATVLRGELERLAREDPLTAAVNRREFLAELRRRLDDRRATVGLVVLDLDRFKSINDRFGHHAGDAALVAVVRALRGAVRDGDVVARLGGEEFAVAVDARDAGALAAAAERMRRAVAEHPPVGLDRPVTASFGVAVPAEGESVEALMARADAAMYRAKRGGGDAVVTAAVPATVPQRQAG